MKPPYAPQRGQAAKQTKDQTMKSGTKRRFGHPNNGAGHTMTNDMSHPSNDEPPKTWLGLRRLGRTREERARQARALDDALRAIEEMPPDITA